MDAKEIKLSLKNARDAIKNKDFKTALQICKVSSCWQDGWQRHSFLKELILDTCDFCKVNKTAVRGSKIFNVFADYINPRFWNMHVWKYAWSPKHSSFSIKILYQNQQCSFIITEPNNICLSYCAMWDHMVILTFWRNMLVPSSGLWK